MATLKKLGGQRVSPAVNVRLPPKLIERAVTVARREGITLSDVVRRAVIRDMAREAPDAPTAR